MTMIGTSIKNWLHPPVDESWKSRAACRGEDPQLWFPASEGQRHYDRDVRALTMIALAICGRCPVRQECRDFAIEIDARFGTYGGLTEGERARITGRKVS